MTKEAKEKTHGEPAEKFPVWVQVLTWFLRIICGGLFIFSGFVKAIDPWGTIFKIEDYMAAFGAGVPFGLLRLGVFGLCAVEFIVGTFLLMGCFRKSCPIFGCFIMVFMTPFTLWIAIENPVADCGCFGDALLISNWLTFWKNIVLSGGLIWLVRYNISALPLIAPAIQWLQVVGAGIFILIIELIGFFYQPLLDFRNYPVGSTLFANYDEEDEAEYDEEDNDDFDDEHGLDVFDINDGEDKTEEAQLKKGKELVVMIPKISMVSPASTWKLNSLYEWSSANNVKMIGIVSGSPAEVEDWEDLSMASYPLYLADDTAIKEVVRGNPGIVYLVDGRIVWKTTLSAIDADDFQAPEISGDASTFAGDNARILLNCIIAYLIFNGAMIFMSFTPKIAKLFIRNANTSSPPSSSDCDRS